MKYNFDEIIDRKNTNCEKYDDLIEIFGNNIYKDPITDDGTKKSLKGLNIEIFYESQTALMVAVGDYDTSCKIGSKHWCIATSKHMWDNYVDGTTKQFFAWDFTKKISDKEHMIGVTVGLGNKIKYAHWSDDSRVNNPDSVLDNIE